jgi:hypothetical protein
MDKQQANQMIAIMGEIARLKEQLDTLHLQMMTLAYQSFLQPIIQPQATQQNTAKN